jgi:Tol biopolymer transport system component
MARGNRITFPLAVCLLLGACGHFAGAEQPSSGPSAILLSVSSDAVYLVDARTGGSRQVAIHLSDFQGGYAAWSPDHSRFAYGDNGIVLFEPRGNHQQQLVQGRSLSMPAWSSDGRSLVYGDGISLWVTSLADVAPARIQVPAILAPLEMAWATTGVIAFEGLALDCSQVLRCVSTGSSEIWTILPDGTGLTQLTHVGHAEKPKWSPDGLRFLFVRRFPKTQRPAELWMAEADGSGPRRVAGGSVLAADWSPDGSALVVARKGAEPKTIQMWIGHADGSNLRSHGRPVLGTDATVDW